jgi:hypothetical protein
VGILDGQGSLDDLRRLAGRRTSTWTAAWTSWIRGQNVAADGGLLP